MKFIECLASYVPGLIVDRLIRDCDSHVVPQVPWRQEYETVCVFCDVSGFTALSEAMAMNGKGAEGLAKHLNSYFSQMVRIIASDGGDVFKFAGDAMIVLWPESQSGDMETTVRRAAQCAVEIQENLDQSLMEEGVQLSVKIGIGFGKVSVLHVGGVYGRVEYLAVGEPLIQAFTAEHHSVSGQVICSKDVWKIISEYFPAEHIFPDGYARLNLEAKNDIKLVRKSSKMNTLRNNMSDTDPLLEARMKSYVAGAVLPNLNRDSPEDEQWGNESRRCCIMFVNLGLKDQHLLAAAVYDEAMTQVHEVLMTVQKSVYQYEGSINKFLMDDKGSTLIACFGLPPVSHDDDPTRAVLASLLLCEGLYDLGLIASVGITTGDVFCGVVGGKTRREYTVLGDSVNLSARLMQKAGADGGGVLCDWDTKSATNGTLNFITLDEIKVKGKTMPVKVFRPYAAINGDFTIKGIKGPNIYHDIHKRQLQNAAVFRSLLSLQRIFTPENAESSVTNSMVMSLSHSSRSLASSSIGGEKDSLSSIHSKSSVRRTSVVAEHTGMSGPSFRTRKSVIRSSVISTPGLNHPSPTEMELPQNSPEHSRRGSSTSFKLPYGQNGTPKSIRGNAFRDSVASGFRNRSYTAAVNVMIAGDLRMDFTHSDSIRSIKLSEVSDFAALRVKIFEVATLAQVMPSDVTSEDLAINISGTRFFLPDYPYSIKWLSVFYQEAKSSFPDNWSFGQAMDVIVCLKSEVRKAQSRLALASRVLLERKIDLLENRGGSATLIEGEAGVGKTHMLAKFIKHTLPNTVPIYYAPASPYSLEPYGPFSLLIQQYLDSQVLKFRERFSDRTAALKDLLQRGGNKMLCDGPLLDRHLGTTLGEDLLKECGSDDVEDAGPAVEVDTFDLLDDLSPSQKAARRLQLYYFILYAIGCEQPAIIIIDEAHSVDDESWALLLLLSLAVSKRHEEISRSLDSALLPDIGLASPSLMIVVSLRPLLKYRSVFRGPSPVYEAFQSIPSVARLKIDGLPPEETEELLLSKLGGNVATISDPLIQLIDEKCLGNPWKMIEFVETLRTAEPPVLSFVTVSSSASLPTLDENASYGSSSSKVASKRMSMTVSTTESENMLSSLQEVQVDLTEDFRPDKCPLPFTVAKTYGTLLDRLSSCQQMILKTASYIGKQFSWSGLYSCYPLEGHKYRLKNELDGLLTLGYILEIPNYSHKPDHDQQYHFVSDFLLELINIRMLKEQKEKVRALVLKWRADVEARQRKLFMAKAMPGNMAAMGALKTGLLEIQKKVTSNFLKLHIKRKIQGGDWKQRMCVLNASSSSSACNVSLYRDMNHYRTSPSTPTQVIFLQGAFAQIEPDYVKHEKEFVFRLDAQQYLKEKNSQEENRSFLFAGLSTADITDWVYMIKYAIELAQSGPAAAVEDADGPERVALAAYKATRNRTEGCDMDLHVRVVGVKNLYQSDVYGSSNYYVSVGVDADKDCTPVAVTSENKHTFNSKFEFPVSRRQWLRKTLSVSVNVFDVFLTDEVIGSTEVDLASSAVLVDLPSRILTEEEAAALQAKEDSERKEEGVWYPIQFLTKTGVHIRGEVCLVIEVVMNSDMKALLAQSGSLEAMKTCIRSILDEEDELANSLMQPKPVSVRIGTMDDLKSLLNLAQNDSGGEEGASVDKTQLKRMVHRLRNASEAGGLTAHFSKKLTEKLHDLLRVVNDSSAELKPTLQSGSVNKMWVCRQLRDLIRDFGVNSSGVAEEVDESDMRNPFKHMMEQASSLDQQHLDWLASQYTRDSTTSMVNSDSAVNLSREETVQKKARRASVTASVRSDRTLSKRMSFLVDPSCGSSDPNLFDDDVDMSEGYYCMDAEGEARGPFSANEIYGWLIGGELHVQVLVHHGSSSEGEFYPLGLFERSLRRVITNSFTGWPPTLREAGNDQKLPAAVGIFGDRSHVIHNFYSWNFDVWDLEPHELLPLSMLVMSSLGLSDGFEIDPKVWRSFMDKVKDHMTKHNNPYHNYYHISDVTQTVFVFLSEMGAFELLRSHEILALVVGAVVHDLDHTGTNNLYHVNARTELAIQYNDNSVLENHHCALAFQTTQSSSCNIFESLDVATFRSVRKLIISIVLATDMTCHFALKGDLDDLVKRKFSGDASGADLALEDKDRETLMKAVLHTADISNPAKCWRVSKKWSDLVVEEFFNQGDREKREGLPVSPNMDRLTTQQDELSVNFTDFIVAPFFLALTAALPRLNTAVTEMEKNRDEWHSRVINRLSASATSAQDPAAVEETVAKWEKRKIVFAETVAPILARARAKIVV